MHAWQRGQHAQAARPLGSPSMPLSCSRGVLSKPPSMPSSHIMLLPMGRSAQVASSSGFRKGMAFSPAGGAGNRGRGKEARSLSHRSGWAARGDPQTLSDYSGARQPAV